MVNTTTIKLETGKVSDDDIPSTIRNGAYEIAIIQEGEHVDDIAVVDNMFSFKTI